MEVQDIEDPTIHLPRRDSFPRLPDMDIRPDWQNGKSVLECNKFMLENHIESDIEFVLQTGSGRNVRVPAHKYVLMSRNPVFFAMFSGPMAESGKAVNISDVSPTAFRQMLSYLYHEEIELTIGNVFPLLYTAKKYLVTALAERCLRFLEKASSAENVCTLLEYDFLFSEEDSLVRKCWQLIERQTKRVLDSHAFYRISRETLVRILQRNRLSVKEIDLFRACVVWAERRCAEEGVDVTSENKREMMGAGLFMLRLASLNLSDFSQTVVSSGILQMGEENCLYRHLMGDKSNREVPFLQTEREKCTFKCCFMYNGFVKHNTTRAAFYDGYVHRSKWSVAVNTDRNIILNEFGFLGSFKGTVIVSQNGVRLVEITSDSSVNHIRLVDDLNLEVGTFVISAETPFNFVGEYFSKSVVSPLPMVDCDQEIIELNVHEVSNSCFLSYILFSMGEQLNFIEDFYSIEASETENEVEEIESHDSGSLVVEVGA